MTDLVLLNDRIKESGFRKPFLAQKLGISRQAFYAKLAGKNEFNSNQIQIMCKTLGINPKDMKAIFFAETVD